MAAATVEEPPQPAPFLFQTCAQLSVTRIEEGLGLSEERESFHSLASFAMHRRLFNENAGDMRGGALLSVEPARRLEGLESFVEALLVAEEQRLMGKDLGFDHLYGEAPSSGKAREGLQKGLLRPPAFAHDPQGVPDMGEDPRPELHNPFFGVLVEEVREALGDREEIDGAARIACQGVAAFPEEDLCETPLVEIVTLPNEKELLLVGVPEEFLGERLAVKGCPVLQASQHLLPHLPGQIEPAGLLPSRLTWLCFLSLPGREALAEQAGLALEKMPLDLPGLLSGFRPWHRAGFAGAEIGGSVGKPAVDVKGERR